MILRWGPLGTILWSLYRLSLVTCYDTDLGWSEGSTEVTVDGNLEVILPVSWQQLELYIRFHLVHMMVQC